MNTKQLPDTKPGAYFVTCVDDAGRVARLAGPYVNDHASALDAVDAAKAAAEKCDPRAVWYAYGTCRVDLDSPSARKSGVLNLVIGLQYAPMTSAICPTH